MKKVRAEILSQVQVLDHLIDEGLDVDLLVLLLLLLRVHPVRVYAGVKRALAL